MPEVVQAQEYSRDPRFGVVEAFWDSGAANEAGAAWERILFYWSQIQPNGPNDWNTLHVPDEWLQNAQAQGREVVGLIKNTPSWAASLETTKESTPPRGLDLPIDDPGNLWASFVRRLVSYYGARGIHHWIIWNEPDIKPGVYGEEWGGTVEEYVQLLKVAYLVIKQTDPTATVHLAGITFWHDRKWLDNFLAAAAADPDAAANNFFFDVASLHIYFQTDTVDYIVNIARASLAAYGLQKPIWINETNASPDSDPLWPVVRPAWRVDLQEQSSFILQAFALGLAAGAQRIAVYKLIDSGLPPGGEPFGLMRPDHSRRPAFTGFQLATHYYTGAQTAQTARDPLWAQVTLYHADRTTRVLWARTKADVSLTLPATTNSALLVDQEGNEQTLDGSTGSYSLVLPGARCADEAMGCIIGGPTFLLIEYGATGSPGDPAGSVDEPTISGVENILAATEPISPSLPISTTNSTPIPTSTSTSTPTPEPSQTETSTATPEPFTLTPSTTPIPPTSTPTTSFRTATPGITAVTPALSPSPTPDMVGASTTIPDKDESASDYIILLLGLAAALALAVAIWALWRIREG